MKKANEKDVLTIQTANETEIALTGLDFTSATSFSAAASVLETALDGELHHLRLNRQDCRQGYKHSRGTQDSLSVTHNTSFL